MQLNDPKLLRTDAYIDGKWVAANKRFAVTNPANGEVIAEVADLGASDVTAAIDAAVPAQKAWAKKTAKERAMVMRVWYDLIMANAEDLAVILTTEMGKPLAEARGEVTYGASFVDWFAEEARRVAGTLRGVHVQRVEVRVLVARALVSAQKAVHAEQEVTTAAAATRTHRRGRRPRRRECAGGRDPGLHGTEVNIP